MKARNTIFGLLILTVLISGAIHSEGHEGEDHTLTVIYDIENDQSEAVTWYDNGTSTKYIYSSSDTLNLTIYNIENPDSQLDIAIGNLTVENVKDSTASSNLVLGYWKIGGELGFIANLSWQETKTKLEGLENVTTSFRENTRSDFLGVSIDVVEIALNDSFQRTSLIYRKSDGLLLSSNTTSFGFTLNFTIHGLIEGGVLKTVLTSNETTPLPIVGLIVAVAIIQIRTHGRKARK